VIDSSVSDVSEEARLIQKEPEDASASGSPDDAGPPLHSQREWLLLGLLVFVALVGIPLLNRVPATESALRLPDYLIPLLGKFVCYAMVALALDLIWGYAGILSLGHGVFFALGGYAMGMHLMRTMAGEGVYRSELPDFMVFLDWKELPWYRDCSRTHSGSSPFARGFVASISRLSPRR
jgi:ABC-type branched-subunit amino acid transport system permease subunit